jgi:hypothetical protein
MSMARGSQLRLASMTRTRPAILLALLLLVAVPATADRTEFLLARTWPAAQYAALPELGTGLGIVFSPDLSVPENCRFFQALGFACFQSPDWLQVLADIHTHNTNNPGRRIRTLILETHGTNGHGLKLQTGKNPTDDRSYISVGALQEMLEPVGVRYIVISACNSGRLLRPEIYLRLNRDPGDKLFLPATRGIIDASTDFTERYRNNVQIITPATSHIETTLVGQLRELAPKTRKAITAAAKTRGVKLPKQFAISEMLIQMLLRDPELKLQVGGSYVDELSKDQTTPQESEELFDEFVARLNFIAARDSKKTPATTKQAAR